MARSNIHDISVQFQHQTDAAVCIREWNAPHRQKNAAITRRRNSPQIDIEDYLEGLRHERLTG